jgi:hypothetical protein
MKDPCGRAIRPNKGQTPLASASHHAKAPVVELDAFQGRNLA